MAGQDKHTPWLTPALFIGAILTIGCGFFGWMYEFSHAPDLYETQWPVRDALYRAFSALVLPDSYENSGNWNQNIAVECARWLGLATFALATIEAFRTLLKSRFDDMRAQRRRNHIFLVGSAPFAQATATAALAQGQDVTWLAANEAQTNLSHRNVFVSAALWQESWLTRYNAARAESIIVAATRDTESIAIASQIAATKAVRARVQHLHVALETPWLATRLESVSGLRGVHVVSQTQAAARHLHRRFPPFLLAHTIAAQSDGTDTNKPRIHSVFFGFDGFAEAVLTDTLLSSLTPGLAKPLFSIVSDRRAEIEAHFALRYPELSQSADLHFVSGSLKTMTTDTFGHIRQKAPITGVYVCMDDSDDIVSAATALNMAACRDGWTNSPIFVRIGHSGVLPSAEDAPFSTLTAGQVLSFGTQASVAQETGVLSKDFDAPAKQVHAAYRAMAPAGGASNVPWKDLDEDKRESNRRIFTHLAAKIYSAGYDIRPWVARPDIALPHVPALYDDDRSPVHHMLAALEHERWNADRRLNGYRYAKTKQPECRLHPDLVDFEALSTPSKDYDFAVAEELKNILAAAPTDIVLHKRQDDPKDR